MTADHIQKVYFSQLNSNQELILKKAVSTNLKNVRAQLLTALTASRFKKANDASSEARGVRWWWGLKFASEASKNPRLRL